MSSCCCGCPNINVFCDAITASRSKCGFAAYHKLACTFPFTDLGYGTFFSYLGCRAQFGNCAESVSGDSDPNKVYLTEDIDNTGNGNGSHGCGNSCNASGTETSSCTYDDVLCTSSCSGSGEILCEGIPPFPNDVYITGTGTLSNEYTTAMLITNTIADLPPYDGVYGDTCLASRTLSDDEHDYSIRRFKPKFIIPSPRSSNVTICYNEHFIPADGGSPVDTPKIVIITAGNTEVIGDEVIEPSENGQITITGVICC